MKSRLLFLPLFLLFFSSTLQAQNIQLWNYTFNNVYSNFEAAVAPNSLLPMDADEWDLIVFLNYSFVNEPLVTKDPNLNTRINRLIESMQSYNLGVGYRILPRLTLGLGATYNRVHASNDLILLRGGKDYDYVFSDIKMSLIWRATPDKSPVHVSIIPSVTLPTGEEDRFLSNSSLGAGLDVTVERVFKYFHLAASLGFHHSEKAKFQDLDLTEKYLSALAAYIPAGKKKRFGFNLEWIRYWTFSGGSKNNPNEFYFGGRYQAIKPLAFFAGLSLGNLDSVDSNDFRGIAGLKYTPSWRKKEKKVVQPLPPEPEPIILPEPEPLPPPAPPADPIIAAESKKYGKLVWNKSIYFATASSILNQRSLRTLLELKKFIQTHSSQVTKIVIEGHTSMAGSDTYNQKLSQRRARVVNSFLVNRLQIAPRLFENVGYGRSRPRITPVSKSSDNAENRRVEFRIYQREQ